VELKKTREAFREALPLLKADENVREEGTALNNLGQIHFYLFEMAESLVCLNGALDTFRRLGLREEEADAHVSLGAVRITRGDPPLEPSLGDISRRESPNAWGGGSDRQSGFRLLSAGRKAASARIQHAGARSARQKQ